MKPDITLEQSRNIRYHDIRGMVNNLGRPITMEASVFTYNAAFGLIYLVIHQDDRELAFGDDDDNDTDSFHRLVYGNLMDWGNKRLTMDKNKFLFTIGTLSMGGDFGPNTNGLGVLKVKPLGNTYTDKGIKLHRIINSGKLHKEEEQEILKKVLGLFLVALILIVFFYNLRT